MTDTPSKPLAVPDENDRWRLAFPRGTRTTQMYMHAPSPGWEELLWWGMSEIEDELDVAPEMTFTITDIKSKFGTLRFYYAGGNDEIEAIVDTMERRSHTTCEKCGGLGRLRGRGWVYTACQSHTEEKDRYVYRKQQED
jgi:hypothetical protein